MTRMGRRGRSTPCWPTHLSPVIYGATAAARPGLTAPVSQLRPRSSSPRPASRPAPRPPAADNRPTRKELPVAGQPLARRLLAEFVGSAFLAAVVVGSGIAAQRLSPADTGLQLFENAAATAVGLFAIILVVGPVSGAHLNPVVSLVDAAFGGLTWRICAGYVPVQVAGCIAGAVLANLMFAEPAVGIST